MNIVYEFTDYYCVPVIYILDISFGKSNKPAELIGLSINMA